MKNRLDGVLGKAKEISKQTAGAVSSTAKSVSGAAGEVVAKQTEIISEKIEEKKRREAEKRELEVKAAKESISDTIAECVLNLLGVPSPKKQTKNLGKKPNEKNDKYNIKLLNPTAFIPRFA